LTILLYTIGHRQVGFAPEVCRIRSTGVESGRSSTFPTGAGAGPAEDIFDENRS